MKRNKITLKQIARELDVAISTVSKSLKNYSEISEETRKKVQAFAKLHNYRPNNIALSLKNRKTKTIGIIIPEIVHHFFSKIIQGIEQTALKKGYTVIVGLSNESFEKEVINMEMLANGSIDGFILSVAKETMQLQDYFHFTEIINQGMPIVMFDRVINEINCDKVVVDDKNGAKNAVIKLIKNKCKNIALITTVDYVNVGKLRTQGYLEAFEEYGISPKSELIIKIENQLENDIHLNELEDVIENLFKQNKKIDAVFAVNELYAIIAMKMAKKYGFNIPNDIQIIGFSDGVLSRHATPSLTTVSQHAQKIGEKAAEMLIEKLEHEYLEDVYETVIIETELIERKTTL